MATTTNYSWTTPDDTGLVKDGASAIRTLGSSIDTTTKNLNPSTTLGDIEYRSSTANTNTRLAIGSTGNVLTVSGGVPTWAAPAAGGDNFTLLNAGGTALTGAQTITVSGISGKNKIMVLVSGASSASASSFINLRLNTDTANNYNFYGNFMDERADFATSLWEGTKSEATDAFILGRMSNNAGSIVDGSALITGCNSSGVKVIQSNAGGNPAGGENHRSYNLSGYYNSSSTITSISVVSATGNFDAGTVYVYTSA